VLGVAYREVESGNRYLLVSQRQQQFSLRDYLHGKVGRVMSNPFNSNLVERHSRVIVHFVIKM